MSKKNTSTVEIINKFKKKLKTIGLKPFRVYHYHQFNEAGTGDDTGINLIIVSDKFVHIHICERLEILNRTAATVSDRIETIGFTEKELAALHGIFQRKKAG